jgi:hypothetical protein
LVRNSEGKTPIRKHVGIGKMLVILKWVFETVSLTVSAEFNWFIMEISGGLL